MLDGANYIGVGPTFPSARSNSPIFRDWSCCGGCRRDSPAGLCHRRDHAGEYRAGAGGRVRARCGERGVIEAEIPYGAAEKSRILYDRKIGGQKDKRAISEGYSNAKHFDLRLFTGPIMSAGLIFLSPIFLSKSCPTKLSSNSRVPTCRRFPGEVGRHESSPIFPPQKETDVYFAHPARDFARRTRPCGCGGRARRTTSPTKARRSTPRPRPAARSSCRWPRATDAFDSWRPSWKQSVSAPWPKSASPAARLPLPGKAARGGFAGRCPRRRHVRRIRLVVEEREVETAKACILSLAQSLGLTQGERRSYLELLIERK